MRKDPVPENEYERHDTKVTFSRTLRDCTKVFLNKFSIDNFFCSSACAGAEV